MKNKIPKYEQSIYEHTNNRKKNYSSFECSCVRMPAYRSVRAGRLVIYCILHPASCFCIAQQNKTIDSLHQILNNSPSDTAKITILNTLSENLFRQGSYDSSAQYAQQALDMATPFQSENELGHFAKNAIELKH